MAVTFSPIFSGSEIVHVNQSYIIANLPLQATTPEVFFLTMILGIGLLLLSAITTSETCNDLSGILATLFLLISSIQAFAVDTVTGYGAATSGSEWVLLEDHTLYHYDFLGFVLAVIFLISLANLYRLWLDYNKVISPSLPATDAPTVGYEDYRYRLGQTPREQISPRPRVRSRPRDRDYDDDEQE